MWRRLRALAERSRLYEHTHDPEQIHRLQLERLNQTWERAWRDVPFYTQWRTEHRLPPVLTSLDELARFPILTKAAISKRADVILSSPGTQRTTLTGGTSGLSTRFPMGSSDANVAWINAHRSGPRNLDSSLSEISIVFQAAVPKPVAPKYTTSGVRRPSELWRRRPL